MFVSRGPVEAARLVILPAVRSGCFLTDVDEVARSLRLTRGVRLKITVDAVLHFAVEGLPQQTCEALQAVGVVGQTKLAAENRNIQMFSAAGMPLAETCRELTDLRNKCHWDVR